MHSCKAAKVWLDNSEFWRLKFAQDFDYDYVKAVMTGDTSCKDKYRSRHRALFSKGLDFLMTRSADTFAALSALKELLYEAEPHVDALGLPQSENFDMVQSIIGLTNIIDLQGYEPEVPSVDIASGHVRILRKWERDTWVRQNYSNTTEIKLIIIQILMAPYSLTVPWETWTAWSSTSWACWRRSMRAGLV